jgi:hypothetical protein
MGAGVAVLEANGDGAPDLLFVQSGPLAAGRSGDGASSALYLNDGKGRFTDVSTDWQLPRHGYGMGVAVGDVDRDGRDDLLITTYGAGDALWRNTGESFQPMALPALGTAWDASAGFFDGDLDGDLDLFIVRYVDYDVANAVKCYQNQLHVYCTPDLFRGTPDVLFRNDSGRFSDATRASQIVDAGGKGLALVAGDVNLDGKTDLYVANDQTRNNLYIARGPNAFEDIGLWSGVGYGESGKEEASMGADFADVDGDARVDIVCTNFQGEPADLYLQGDGLLFRELSDARGIGAPSRARLKFGCELFDADNDGDEDLAIANGHIDDRVSEHSPGLSFEQTNTLFESTGAGEFRDVSGGAGDPFGTPGVFRGLVTSDLDGDGDLDLVFTRNDAPPLIARNETNAAGRFVGLWLVGREVNPSAIGAIVRARVGEKTIVRQVQGSESYLSSSDRRVHLGLGEGTRIDALTIEWPGSTAQEIGALDGGHYYRIEEGRPPVAFVPGGWAP